MYGQRGQALWSDSEVRGQLVVGAIWAVALAVLLVSTCGGARPLVKGARGGGMLLLRTAMLLFVAAFAFLCTRYGLVLAGNDVPIGYRHEASVVVLLQRLAMAALLAGAYAVAQGEGRQRLGLGVAVRALFWIGLAAYLVLNVAYAIMDFLVSAHALDVFRDSWSWRLGDRDFALAMDAGMVDRLKANQYTVYAPGYVASRMWIDPEGDDADVAVFRTRDPQIKIGVAADAIALVIVLGLLFMVLGAWVVGRKAEHMGKRTVLLLVATAGLLLTTLFDLVVSAHYVLWNWSVVTSFSQWDSFVAGYEATSALFDYIAPPGFLPAYRVTVDGFPVVRAVLEPFGIVLACAAIVVLVRAEARDRQASVAYPAK